RKDHRLVLVQPLTYVNRTGEVLPALLKRFNVSVENLLVVVDQLDLAPGMVRVKPRGGHAGHNGLKSIEENLKSQNYRRLWVGVGRPRSGAEQIAHVLGRPEPDDFVRIQSEITRASELLWSMFLKLEKSETSIQGDFWENFQNEVNQRPTPRP
ncbi:MAG: aminoacyl-tRNA hydrolase, partial [Spirochaetales bacterium]|nr:aminoacyl-tRNA hydrolase [Spirochaetales bacterium]